jgi:hypothetical protein
MNGYKAFYKGRTVEVYAETSYKAQQAAAILFKTKKSYDVTVVLCERMAPPSLTARERFDQAMTDKIRPLNKTETELLDLIRTRGIAGVTRLSGFGADGGRPAYGNRQFEAAQSLIKRGLAVEVDRAYYDETRRGRTIRVADLTIAENRSHTDGES